MNCRIQPVSGGWHETEDDSDGQAGSTGSRKVRVLGLRNSLTKNLAKSLRQITNAIVSSPTGSTHDGGRISGMNSSISNFDSQELDSSRDSAGDITSARSMG